MALHSVIQELTLTSLSDAKMWRVAATVMTGAMLIPAGHHEQALCQVKIPEGSAATSVLEPEDTKCSQNPRCEE